MTILVLGATGTVGREVVRALVERDAHVRALVRSPERARPLLPSSLELVAGDVRDRGSLARAFRGVSAAFYVSPHEPDEEALAENVVEAAEASGVRLVFLGVHADGRNRFTRAVQRMFFGLHLPHYRPKLRLSERIRRSRTKTTILLATNFFQNDELYRTSILAGEFVVPLAGINRVDVRDIGDGAARVLLDESLAEAEVPIVGPETLSGEQSAAAWSRAIGREVRYMGADLARFEHETRRVLEGKKLDDVLASYRALAKLTVPTDPQQLAATTALLGRPPRSYDRYVRDTLAEWVARASNGHVDPPSTNTPSAPRCA